MLLGSVTGLLAFGVDVATEYLQHAKYRLAGLAFGAGFLGAVLALILISVCFVVMAACLVLFVEPIAGGSGIPEVKTYLQRVKLPRMLRLSTLLAKLGGLVCSIAAGLVCGKEGPMVHAGAIVANGLSQGSSRTLRCRLTLLGRFRNDQDRRDFVSAGAAAGVAAAFGSPIGGVLFAVEEAATHWSQALTWRTFFAALASTGSLNLLQSALGNGGAAFGQLSHPGMLAFGPFLASQGNDRYGLPELLVFAMIGLLSGLLGAAFVYLSKELTLGLFVPSIMAGGAVGRLVGEAVTASGLVSAATSPGNYALIGAAGMLGGICRMTISLTVIIIESTGAAAYSLPIALTIVVAKLIGDVFTKGIYDVHAGLKGYPVLPVAPDEERRLLRATDVMNPNLRTVGTTF